MSDRPDTSLFLEFCRGLLVRGIGFRFEACGTSMMPAIRDGEVVYIEPVRAEELRKGDVVLFEQGDELRLHRLVIVDHQKNIYVARGDARAEDDTVMNSDRILGRAVGKEKTAAAVRLSRIGARWRQLLTRNTVTRVASLAANLSFCAAVSAVLLFGGLVLPPTAMGQGCAVPGTDGNGGTLTGVINTYYPGTASVAIGARSIPVGTPTGAAAAIATGDLLLVIQMQDADIASNNNNRYGGGIRDGSGWSALNSTGMYEFVRATGPVAGNAVPIVRGTTSGLLHAYHYAAGTSTYQVVRVPQYSQAQLGSGLTAAPWNGSTGGILAMDVAGNVDLGGATVTLDGIGFRGGAGLQLNGAAVAATDYRWAAPTAYAGVAVAGAGGSKGEGIAGTPRWVQSNGTYLNTGVDGFANQNGSMGRGAPGNAGGGGNDSNPVANDRNAGGGGGSNGGFGGQGGNSWNSNDAIGGIGGTAFPATQSLVVMGGGGGAGSRNNDPGDTRASSGAAGGGIVIIRAGSLSGTGTITANGAAAYNLTANDGGGGGGAGGSIVVVTANGSTAGLSLQARGGRGGDAWNSQAYTDANRHGPGAGGGGGVVFTSGAPTNIDVSGGASGITLNPGVLYGAEPGDPGTSSTAATLAQFSGIDSGAECSPDLTITSSHTDGPYRGTALSYSLVVSNVSTTIATSGLVTVTDVLPFGLVPTGASGTGWTCSTVQQTATCTTPNVLAANTSYPAITVTTLVTQAAPDSMVNTATVSGGGDFNLTNNTANDLTNVQSAADLAVTTSAPAAVAAGATLTYTHTVSNNGPSDATNAVFMQKIPANTTFASVSAQAGWSCSAPAVGGAGVVSCTALNVATATATNLSVVVTVPVGTANGTVINETASIGSLILDPATANNAASVITVVGTTAQADLAVSNSGTPNPVRTASNVTFNQTVINAGTVAAASGATLTEVLPANVTYVSMTSPDPTHWPCTYTLATRTVRCTANTTIAAGWTGVFALVVTANSGASVADTVTVSATNDGVPGNNSATATVAVAAGTQADIGISTVGSPNPVVAGDNISYTHVISSNGPGTAGAITFTQTLPANTTFQSMTIPLGITCATPAVGATGTITCTVPAGATTGLSASTVVTVKVNPAATGTISSTATVSSGADPVATNNSTTTNTPIITRADLTLTSAGAPVTVAAGANITYQHTVTNAGPSVAAAVTFTEAVPPNSTFQSISAAGWTCATPAVNGTGTISCTIASFAPAATANVQIVVKVNAGVPAGTAITGLASVATSTYETNQADNATTVVTSVSSGTQADLSLTNVGAPSALMAGNNITYTQVVKNNGPAAAAALTYTDILPANETFASLSAPAGWTCSTPAVGSAGTVTCTIATLAANAVANFSLVLKVDPSTASGSIASNTASINSLTSDPYAGNNSATSSTDIATQADLSVTTTAPSTVLAGNNISYTQTLTNNGPSSAATVVWTQVLPANTTFQSLAAPGGWNCVVPAIGASGTITCSIATLRPGTVSFPVVVKANAGLASGTAISNSVSVTSTTNDPTAADHAATAIVIVAASTEADVSVTNVGSPSAVQAGANITYAQQVLNSGPAAASTLSFTQAVPANTTFVSISSPAAWTCTTPAPGANGTVSCTATTLASGATASFSLVVQVDAQAPAGATITDTAKVTSTTGDPAAANNTAAATNKVTSSNLADLAVTMLPAPDPVLQGSALTYTATVMNNGPDAATHVLFTDALPAGVSYVSADTSSGTCSFAGGTVSCAIGTLNSGASTMIAIVVNADAPDLISNTALVSADQSDLKMVNNEVTVISTIAFPTEVKLKSFTATNSGGSVTLQWATGSESHNLGFNLYREESGQRVRINPSLVAGSALRLRRGSQAQAGKAYAFLDSPTGVQPAYWLEDVDLNGVRTLHGPVYPTANSQGSLQTRRLTAALSATATFAEIARASSGAAQPTSRSRIANAAITPASATSAQQRVQFALAATKAVKIEVDREGLYRLPISQLVAAGLVLRDIDALRLFAEGIEQPIQITYLDGDSTQPAIEFYGTGLDTQYSKARVYWLVQGDTRGLRIQQQSAAVQTGQQAQTFQQRVELRDRTTFFAALITPDGNNFFGDLVSSTPLDQVLFAQNVGSPNGFPVTVEVVLQGVVSSAPHQVEVLFNGVAIGQLSFGGQSQGKFMVEVPSDLLREGANTVTLTALNGDDDISLVDHVALTYPRTYVAEANSLRFTANAGDNVTVSGFTSPARVLDITDPAAPIEVLPTVTNDGGSYSLQVQVPWSAIAPRVFFAVGKTSVSSPVRIVSNHPSHWHTPQRGADIVMIAHPDFVSALMPLTQKRSRSGQLVSVITTDQIYDEFNFGEKDPHAIRNLLKTASLTWSRKPRYLLLVGDASVDPLNNLGMGWFDFVPTKIVPTASLMTASDDWFSDFTDSGLPQISTGRLPARTPDQAKTLVAKILAYESTADSGQWQRQVLMVADKDDQQSFSGDSLSVQSLLARTFQVTDIFASKTPTAKNDIVAAINSGKLLVNYIGHGSVDTWSDEGLLDLETASSLQNGAKLPLVLAINCLNGYFYDVYQDSMAEALMLAENGGAIAVVASSGLTDPGPQVEMDRSIVGELSENPAIALGDAVRFAKSAVADSDVRRTYMLFGDPAMRLNVLSIPAYKHIQPPVRKPIQPINN